MVGYFLVTNVYCHFRDFCAFNGITSWHFCSLKWYPSSWFIWSWLLNFIINRILLQFSAFIGNTWLFTYVINGIFDKKILLHFNLRTLIGASWVRQLSSRLKLSGLVHASQRSLQVSVVSPKAFAIAWWRQVIALS